MTNMTFAGKVVIVTGGSSGIGAAIALHFVKEGAHVVIVDKNEARLNEITAQFSKVGKAPLFIKADVTTDDVKTIVKKTVEKFGKIDVLVNSAGIHRTAALDDTNLEQIYDEVMNTNLRSIFVLTNLAVPYLIKSKGNVVNISSVAGSGTSSSFARSGGAAYGVSKAGVDHFTRYAAMELAPKGVRVNAVSPGPVRTPILEVSGNKATWDHLREMTALKIIIEPEEIADLVLYLASDKARSITGSNYLIDGGVLIN